MAPMNEEIQYFANRVGGQRADPYVSWTKLSSP